MEPMADLEILEAKVDKLIEAVNSIGALCDTHAVQLETIVTTVQQFTNDMSKMNPLQMMKSVMGKKG